MAQLSDICRAAFEIGITKDELIQGINETGG